MKNCGVPKRLLMMTFLVGFLGTTGAMAAFAASASSNFKDTGTVNGYSYENQATVNNTNNNASTYVQTTNFVNVPSGYMGAWAGLYQSNGTLCKQSAWYYNSGPAGGIDPATNDTYCGSGNYYSYGESKAYTGSGYDTYHTYMSPELGFS